MLNDIQESKDDVSFVLVFKLSHFGKMRRMFSIVNRRPVKENGTAAFLPIL